MQNTVLHDMMKLSDLSIVLRSAIHVVLSISSQSIVESVSFLLLLARTFLVC